MNKALIAFLVALILAAGGWAVYNNGKSKDNSTYTTSNNYQNSNSLKTSAKNQPSASDGKVTIANNMFTPSQITVTKGSTVTWTNNDSVAHTVTNDLNNTGGPASNDIAPGSTYGFTFAKTGSFQYHCKIHPSMRATIVVQ